MLLEWRGFGHSLIPPTVVIAATLAQARYDGKVAVEETMMPESVQPRPAASLLLIQDPLGTPSVLMGQRGAFHKFMPGRLVFPGGGVDPEDAHAKIAAAPLPHALTNLERLAGADLAHGLLCATARELDEEAGLSLGNPPDLSGLDFLCRAITPPANPIRFDAYFFIADASAASGTLGGSGELEELRWYPLAEALTLDLAFVTGKILLQAQQWLGLSAEMRASRSLIPVMRDREWNAE
jgi:8-oxo-dGTP pyrophosphatase MutT (NUDIX family)